MTAVPIRLPEPTRGLSPWTRILRGALTVLGWLLIVVGLVGAVLPGHLGVPVLVVGLILVLRHSFSARRQFIGLQRKHPKIVFPLRRLLRREPEVFPVAYQQVLRMEKMVLPKSWRRAQIIRRHLRTRHRAKQAAGS